MTSVIEPVPPSRFGTWVLQRPFMVLFLGPQATVRRPRSVVDGLGTLFPGQVGAGWLASDAVSSKEWWARNWRTEFGPYRQGLTPPPGCYLFHLGYVAGYSPETAHAGGELAWGRVREYLVERIRLKAASGAGTDWSRTGGGASSGTGGASAPSSGARRGEETPYELLEVAQAATDEEVKKAFRTAVKLNHPDRVAHLSKAIQEFARQRTQRIIEAWQTIKEQRGIR